MTKYSLLLLGDSHIPRRAKELPADITKELNNLGKFDYTFFTGDLVIYDMLIDNLGSITANSLFRVMGNMDYYAGQRDCPIYEELKITMNNNEAQEDLIIGLTHGSEIRNRGDPQELEELAQKKNYHVLISGHTHKEEIVLRKSGILLLNPGSITGAWSFIASKIPSFIIIYLDSNTGFIDVQLNQLKWKTNSITKTKYHFIFEDSKIKQKY